MRYIDRDRNTVNALIASVPSVSETGTALQLEDITYLTSLVTSVAVNGRGDKASYVVSTDNGSSIYTVTAKGVSLIASSFFKEWTISYGGETLFATTKPSAYIEGVTARLPAFSLQVTPKTGLMSNPNGSGGILNSMWSASGLLMFMSDDNGDTVLPIKTLASKCTWGEKDFLLCAIPKTVLKKSEGYPDDWFQGRTSFNDDIYIVDSKTGQTVPFYYFEEGDGVFDVTNINLIKSNDILSFIKKQDSTLWLINTNFLPVE